MDIRKYNRQAWDTEVRRGNRWTVPVDSEVIRRARAGDWSVVLTPRQPVPRDWFGSLAGARCLCLACGGGQQGPVLSAAGAQVTVFDNSPAQLAQDRLVADREGLSIETVEGDMADLSVFPERQFDLIVHPCSNTFVSDVKPVWQEAHRVLRPGGRMMAGFTNPIEFIFDFAKAERGELEVRHAIPYSDLASLSPAELAVFTDRNEPLCFGHSLEDQIGGQLAAGFVLTAMYEDRQENHTLSRYIAPYIATLAEKPRS